jgi:hypothetical protein
MTRYFVQTNAASGTYEAEDREGAIRAFVADAGYSSIESAAEACNKSVEAFLVEVLVAEFEEE